MFKRLYDWLMALAQGPNAEWALAAVAFAESSFFPLPPDLLLAPMALAKPRAAWRYAAIAALASVAGGALGYWIGAALYDSVGVWLIDLYGYQDRVAALKETYAQYGAWVILLKGLTPIPYKLVTIVSGLLGYSFWTFIGLSLLTRGARFFIVAGLLHRFGDPLRAALERHFAAFLAIIARHYRHRLLSGGESSMSVEQSWRLPARNDALAIAALGALTIGGRLDLPGLWLSTLRSLPGAAHRLLRRHPSGGRRRVCRRAAAALRRDHLSWRRSRSSSWPIWASPSTIPASNGNFGRGRPPAPGPPTPAR